MPTFAKRRIEIRCGPAAEGKPAGGIFRGTAGRLHDAIQADKSGNNDPAHVCLLLGLMNV